MVSVCAKKIGDGKDIEKVADMFASYFLMPDASLITMAQKLAEKNSSNSISINDVIRIEQYFEVSHQAAVYRLVHTPYLDQKDANDMLMQPVRRRAEALGYSADLYLPSPPSKRYMTYGNYIDQAEQVVTKGLVSIGKYEELLLAAFRSDLVYGDEEEGGDVID